MKYTPAPTPRSKILRCLLLSLTASFASSSLAGLTACSTQHKPPVDQTTRARPASDTLAVDIQPIKDRFWVDEKIRLKTTGNKPYHLYLFNIDPASGEAIMILPNRLQSDNAYSPNAQMVPDRALEFYSDRPGTEQMVMVASTEALDMNMNRYQPMGNFFSAKSAEFEKSLGVRLGDDSAQQNNPDLFVKTFAINIAGQRPATQSSQYDSSGHTPTISNAHDPAAFISTPYNEYYEGDQFDLVFGANQKGYVHVYSIEPSGAYDLLKVAAVDGQVQTLPIKATAPYGRHTLVALFNHSDRVNHKQIEAITLSTDKSLYVVNQSKRAVATHSIVIKSLRDH